MPLTSTLTALESSGLLRLAQTEPELEYLFRHALVQDAAYGSILKSDRRILHRRVGETLERLYADELGVVAPVLAQHFAEAGDDDRALHYFILAGDTAARLYATTEAIAHYTRALDLAHHLPGDPAVSQWATLYSALGRAYELSDQHSQALAVYLRMAEDAVQRDARPMLLAAWLAHATLHSTMTPEFNPPQAEQLLTQAEGLAQELGDQPALCKILWNQMLAHFFSGRIAESVQYGERALALARALHLREQLAFILNDMAGYSYRGVGAYAAGIAALEEARAIWRELGNRPMLADNCASTAFTLIMGGELTQAEALTEEAYTISRAIGNVWGQAYSRGVKTYVCVEHGRVTEALATSDEAAQTGIQSGFRASVVIVKSLMALLHGYVGAYARGLELAQVAVAHTEAARFWGPRALGTLAFLKVRLGALDEAEALIEQTRSLASEQETLFVYSAIPQLAEAELLLARGDWARAVMFAEQLLANAERDGLRLIRPYALYALGRALRQHDQTAAARATLEEAAREAKAMTTRHLHWRILALRADIESANGHLAEATALRAEARALIRFIADHCPPDLRQSFLQLPDVIKVKSDE
jgi:tetratricopeptide (TPR) repeat protein